MFTYLPLPELLIPRSSAPSRLGVVTSKSKCLYSPVGMYIQIQISENSIRCENTEDSDRQKLKSWDAQNRIDFPLNERNRYSS